MTGSVPVAHMPFARMLKPPNDAARPTARPVKAAASKVRRMVGSAIIANDRPLRKAAARPSPSQRAPIELCDDPA
jgi:hypothetical protein